MSLDSNQLNGFIPKEIGKLASLRNLLLDNNRLTGPIPPEIGGLANLAYLSLQNNLLSGGIPREIGALANLENLYLHNNDLYGCIPTTIENLGKLQYLYISGNGLSGDVPTETRNLIDLADHGSYFGYNHLYTSDSDLRNFLNLKQSGGDWESTQTFVTNIPRIGHSGNCGIFTPCLGSFSDAFNGVASPSTIFVGEGEYQENVVIDDAFTLELTWVGDFGCGPPSGPVIISGPLPPK